MRFNRSTRFFLDLYLEKEKKRKKYIDKLGKSNFLSIDLLYLLGYDLVREPMFFLSKFKPDRAMRSIHEYARILDSPELEEIEFRSYWQQLHEKGLEKNIHVPALIVNSTSTHKTQAIGASVDWDDRFEEVFPLADNLCEITKEGRTTSTGISYGHMASCSNRFPIFSPAARIQNKGYFLDGGYFENSGVLSSIHLYE